MSKPTITPLPVRSDRNRAALVATARQRIYPDGLYRWADLRDVVPLSREGWRLRVRAGTAPAPVTIEPRFTAWRGADILAWLDDPIRWQSRFPTQPGD